MAKTVTTVLLAALLALMLLTASAPVSAGDPGTLLLFAQVEDERPHRNPYAGPEGASPMDDVPMVPMVAGTAGILGVLTVVAFRREWI